MYKYKTRQQAWNEVMENVRRAKIAEALCLKLFNQPNLKGLTTEQYDLFYSKVKY